nr:retrovirus-related Pol polyprotein from transposon TNT 1-94 [Tanacetum cinerariifolium]
MACDVSWKSRLSTLNDENVLIKTQVDSVVQERENIKLEFPKLFNSIKATQTQHQKEVDELIEHFNQKTYASQNQDILMTISELKNKIKTIEKGKNVNTKFNKSETSRTLFCVTPLSNNIAVKAKKVLNTTINADRDSKVIQLVLWIVDSGCSKHITENLQLLRNFKKFMGTVRFRNDHFAVITRYGYYVQGNLTICHVYYVEGLGHNLFSVKQFYDRDLEVAFCSNTCYVWNSKGDDLLTEFKNKKLCMFYAKLGIVHNTSIARMPQQNGVVERRNHTLVEAARTMLIFSKTLEFLWTEAIATACFTHNRYIVYTRYNKTPYELIRGIKPNIQYFHVFGSLCYPTNDRDDLEKVKQKADIGIFIGYSESSRDSSKDSQSVPSKTDLDNLFGPLYEEYYVMSPSEGSDNSAANTLDNNDTSSSSIIVEEDEAPQIVHLQEDVAEFDGDVFYNSPQTHVFEEAESSLTYQDPSNMHKFYQRQRSTNKWTKNHPIEQVIGDPSKPVIIRRRLPTDAEVCKDCAQNVKNQSKTGQYQYKIGSLQQKPDQRAFFSKKSSNEAQMSKESKFRDQSCQLFKHDQPENLNELFQKLLKDLKELAEYKESLKNSSNEIASSNSNPEKEGPPQDFDIRQLIRKECSIEVCEEQKQKMEDTILELVEICRQKELLCMHDNVNDLIESALNSKLLSINSQRLDNKEKQKVKNVVEQPTERKTRIEKSLQNFKVIHKNSICLKNTSKTSPVHAVAPILSNKGPEYSPSMGYEHPNTTPKTETDEIIKSGVEELVPILSENKVTSEDKRECDVLVCEDSFTSDVCDDHSNIFSDSKNDDDISSDDNDFEDIEYVEASLSDLEIVRVEEENVVHQEEEVDLKDISQIQDVNLREKLLSINRLIANIESLNDNPIPDRVLNSSILIPIFKESDNSLSDKFSPEFETFCDHTEETRSGSTTTHADDSLPEYDSFCFEIEPDQERLINVVKNDIFDDSSNDPLLEEADLFLASDNSIPPGIENFAYDSDRDIHFLEELIIDDSIPFFVNEVSDFDNPSVPLPPSKL